MREEEDRGRLRRRQRRWGQDEAAVVRPLGGASRRFAKVGEGLGIGIWEGPGVGFGHLGGETKSFGEDKGRERLCT